jgi:MFS family permease
MPEPRLGLRANLAQFTLLVIVNAFVGAMIGMERTIVPQYAEEIFDLDAHAATTSFIVAFGISKALANSLAGQWGDAWGRRPVLLLGWMIALPVPWMLITAPSWSWVLAANVLLGVSQGLTWSTAVVMKIDLAGPAQRGLAMGLNEFAGYGAVAASAALTGSLAATYGVRPVPFYVGVVAALCGLGLSFVAVRETRGHVAAEGARAATPEAVLPMRDVIARTTYADPALRAVTQAGLVNNLNDGVAWGLFPVLFAQHGYDLATIGLLTALYPAVWGASQLVTGGLSDRWGRKGLIAAGMLVQAVGLGAVALGEGLYALVSGQILLGLGTAMVYPTLLAAIGDVAAPTWRARAVGVYRMWRDLGYAIGALLAGAVADALGLAPAVIAVAGLTACSGLWVWFRMPETLTRSSPT